jgi:drug/metabolite transporter (DMT)-like permease
VTSPGPRVDARTWVALGLVYVIWGSTYLGIRLVVETIPPLLGMGTRFLIAGVLLAGIVAVRHGPSVLRVTRRQLLGLWLVGTLLMSSGNGLVAVAEQDVPSGLAALVIAGTPLWIVLLRRLLGVHPRRLSLVGVVVGLAGVAVIVAPGFTASTAGGATATGMLVLLVASISWAIGSVASPRLGLPANPLVSTVHEMLFGGAVMVVAALLRGEAAGWSPAQASTSSWLGFAYLVLVGSLVGYTSYVWLLANAPLPLVSTYAYVNPVVAVLLGLVILGEPITASIAVGGAVVVVGVALVVTGERRSGS